MLDDESTPTPDVTPEPGQPDGAGNSSPGSTRPEPEDPGAEPTAAAGPPRKAAARKAAAKKATAKKATAKKAAVKKAPAKKATTRKSATKKATGTAPEAAPEAPAGAVPADTPAVDRPEVAEAASTVGVSQASPATEGPADPAGLGAPATESEPAVVGEAPRAGEQTDEGPGDETQGGPGGGSPAPAIPLFQPPDPAKAVVRRRTRKQAETPPEPADESAAEAEVEDTGEGAAEPSEEGEGGNRRRRRRGGRRRRKAGEGSNGDEAADGDDSGDRAAASKASEGKPEEPAKAGKAEKAGTADRPARGGRADAADEGADESSGTRRRRRRRRRGEDDGGGSDDPDNTVVRVRDRRPAGDDEISGFTGSTRLEAKKQRRREGREAGRRRAPIVSEAEFLARREAVDRVMVVRQHKDVTQIGVLEDDVLVEHYVARESQTSLIGNVYLGRVQNVLPSMEAAFVDIGKGRNAVLYAGEVNWDLLGKDGQPRRIETALKSGQTVLVQVTKDPVGHKGARLTSQISLPGRYLVYMPGGQNSGISRKLPDTERNRLKNLLKDILPDGAGVIIRTAAEGASEEELRRDVTRLTARWDDIAKKSESGQAPQLLYGEPDLMIKVVRDLFTEDFQKLVISGDDAWDMIEGYVSHVAPDLMERVERWEGDGDVFASYRLDEQIAKALERKVWLPSGGSLIIDRTEAMTVVDVNTGKFTGSGGNLEETVTKNNLEAAEEIVRQLRVRDIGGIIVIDFIDMVLESNRDLVLRRLIECLGRDRTRHQVAEVTSLGLVQMTRKRIGTGMFEAFSEPCESCNGRGYHIHQEPVEPRKPQDDDSRRGRRRRGGDGLDKQDKPSDKQDKRGDKQDKRGGKQPGEHEQSAKQEEQPDKGSGKQTDQRSTPAEQPAEQQQGVSAPGGVEGQRPRGSGGQGQEPADTADSAAGRAQADVAGPARSDEEPGTAEETSSPDGTGTYDPAAVSASAPPPRRSRRRAATRPAGPPQ